MQRRVIFLVLFLGLLVPSILTSSMEEVGQIEIDDELQEPGETISDFIQPTRVVAKRSERRKHAKHLADRYTLFFISVFFKYNYFILSFLLFMSSTFSQKHRHREYQ